MTRCEQFRVKDSSSGPSNSHEYARIAHEVERENKFYARGYFGLQRIGSDVDSRNSVNAYMSTLWCSTVFCNHRTWPTILQKLRNNTERTITKHKNDVRMKNLILVGSGMNRKESCLYDVILTGSTREECSSNWVR